MRMRSNRNHIAKPLSAKPSTNKNVNSYQHFLKNPLINAEDITWANNLRRISLHKSNLKQNVPECYYKNTESFERKTKAVTKGNPGINFCDYEHLLRKRFDHNQNETNVNFEIGLRNSGTTLLKKGAYGLKTFSTLPQSSRTGLNTSKFLKKNCMIKTRNYRQDDFDATFDGAQNYPKYTEKIIREKNLNNYCHMAKGKGNCLPNIAWQTGLRNY